MQSISSGAGILNYNKTRLSNSCWQHLIYTLRNSNKYKPNVNVSDLSAVYLSTKFSKPHGSFISLEISLPNRNAYRLDRGWRSILNPVLEARCFQEGKGQQEFLCRLKLSIGAVTLRYAAASRQVKLFLLHSTSLHRALDTTTNRNHSTHHNTPPSLSNNWKTLAQEKTVLQLAWRGERFLATTIRILTVAWYLHPKAKPPVSVPTSFSNSRF